MEKGKGSVNIDQKSIQTATNEVDEKKEKRRVTRRRILVFFSLQLSLFMAALDGTIISTSLPTIGSDFNSMAISSWVATSYILTQDAFQPIFAKLSDIFGRKHILMIGIVLFEIGSIMCGVSKTMMMLIVCRSIQGIGAGGIFAMVFIIISDIVPLEKRGNYQGIINAVFVIASVFGPLVGGSLTDYASWRWNFYINLPIGSVALVLLFFFLHLPTQKQDFKTKLKRIDYAGSFLVFCAAILFLLAMNFGGQTFPWDSVAVILPLCISVVLVGLLVIVEMKYAKEPLLPPRLFTNRTVVSMLVLNVLWGLVFFSVVYYIPIYFQIVRGDSAMWSGIRMIPMQIVVSVVSITSGRIITRTGRYRPMISTGPFLFSVCVGLFSLFDVNTSWAQIYGTTVIGGLGMGCVVGATVIACQAAVEKRDIAVVTGLNTFSRMLGSALGVAISSAILNTSLRKKLPLVIPSTYAEAIFESPDFVRNGLPTEYFETTIETYVQCLRLVWYILAAFMILAFVSTLFSKHHPLRRQEPPPADPAPSDQKQDHTVIEVPVSSVKHTNNKPASAAATTTTEKQSDTGTAYDGEFSTESSQEIHVDQEIIAIEKSHDGNLNQTKKK